MTRIPSKISESLLGLISVAFLGSIIGKGMRYGMNFVIAQGLDANALGVFTFGLVLLKAGGVIASLGLKTGSQKFISIFRDRGDNDSLAGVVILSVTLPFLVGSAIGGVLYLAWPVFKSMLAIRTDGIVRLFFLGIPLYALLTVGAFATRGFKQTKYFVIVREFVQSGVALALISIAAFVLSSLTGVIYAYFASLAAGAALALYYLYRLGGFAWDRRPKFNTQTVLSVSLPLLVVSVSQFFVSWTDILTLGVFVESKWVGYYQAAYLYGTITFIVFQGANAIFPALVAERFESEELDELQTLYAVITKWGLYLTVLGTILLIVFAEELLRIFGADFTVAIDALVILAVGRMLASAPGPASYLLSMSDYHRLESVNTMLLGLSNLLLNLFLIPRYGIEGAAIATSTSLVLLNLLRLLQVKHLLDVHPFTRYYWKGLAVAAVLTIPILLVKPYVTGIPSLVAVGSVTGVAFLSLVALLGFDSEDYFLLENV